MGNKLDLNEGREVDNNEGMKLKNDFGLDGFIEVSAKTGDGIENLFKQVTKILYNDIFNDSDINTLAKKKIRNELKEEFAEQKDCCCNIL